MGQRTEQRVAVRFPVTVRGTDSRGSPFEASVETHDISCSGACLDGLSKFVEVGSRIEVQHGEQRAWYRVQWVDSGSEGTERAGVRCLEPGTYIWGVPPKEWVPDTYDASRPLAAVPEPVEAPPSPAPRQEWKGADRRQFSRRSCRIEAQVSMNSGSVRLPGTVTDISLGGCYVEMLAPLPVDTVVAILLRPQGGTLEMSGKVRSSQTGLGMGVAFTGMRPEDFEKLQRLAPSPAKPVAPVRISDGERRAPVASAKTSPPSAEPVRQPAPRLPEADPPATPEMFQAVVRLLVRKGLLTRAELIEELEKRKMTRT